MTARTHPSYRHDLLVHDTDDELVAATRAFVQEGAAVGARVLIHSSKDRVDLLRAALGDDPRVDFGFDEEMYLSPTKTLFAYQRAMAEGPPSTQVWVTGTVPLGSDAATQAAWARYESIVNEAFGCYPFRALCTYDTRTRPASVIAAARATHPTVNEGSGSRSSSEYVDPAAFMAEPLARVPDPPDSCPSVVTTLSEIVHLARVRFVVRQAARAQSAVSQKSIEELVMAVNEVAANGLVHGGPPVHVALWADVGTLTCRVVDSGSGNLDPLAGYRYPHGWSPMGLWAARQLVDDLFIGRAERRGCSILMTKT